MNKVRAFISFLLLCLLASAAQAQLKIDINRGHSSPMPIAITDPISANGSLSVLGKQIMQVVQADLERSGLFRGINTQAFLQTITAAEQNPRYGDWRQINAQTLVTSSISTRGNDSVIVAFYLWDVYGEMQVIAKEYNTFRSHWRRIAHLIADEIYKRLTGEDGYFDSRMVYVAESGPANNRRKQLAIMDQDGAQHSYLTDGNSLVLTPRFSPDSQDILYMSYAGRSPRVYLRDLQTGKEQSIGQFEGMSFAPRYADDGTRMLMSIARSGTTNLYEMDLRTRRMVQLTNSRAIDTSPSYAPDGNKIVFESDRGGSQQLYVMDSNGRNIRRISYGDGRYASPVWSPRGDWVAFTKMKGGSFYIGVMRPDGSGERVLDEAFLVEGPSWSPNGRVLVYTRQDRSGGPKLYSIDITGVNRRKIATPLDASDPAWSPLLPN